MGTTVVYASLTPPSPHSSGEVSEPCLQSVDRPCRGHRVHTPTSRREALGAPNPVAPPACFSKVSQHLLPAPLLPPTPPASTLSLLATRRKTQKVPWDLPAQALLRLTSAPYLSAGAPGSPSCPRRGRDQCPPRLLAWAPAGPPAKPGSPPPAPTTAAWSLREGPLPSRNFPRSAGGSAARTALAR